VRSRRARVVWVVIGLETLLGGGERPKARAKVVLANMVILLIEFVGQIVLVCAGIMVVRGV
jgi:hypothetical protein